MVDTTRITELKREIGEEDMILVLSMFVTEAGQTIASIGAGLPDAEHAKAIHFLRSGALNIGLTTFAQQADAAAHGNRAPAETAAMLQSTLENSITQLGLPIPTGQPA